MRGRCALHYFEIRDKRTPKRRSQIISADMMLDAVTELFKKYLDEDCSIFLKEVWVLGIKEEDSYKIWPMEPEE